MPHTGRWTLLLVVPILALSTGCSKPGARDNPGDDTPPLDTRIDISAAAVPERYAAALPSRDAGLARWLDGDAALPPFGHVRDKLLFGDARWLSRLSAAAQSVPTGEADAWARRLDAALQYEVPRPEFCAALRPVMQAPASTLRRALAGLFAGHCASNEDLALVVRADTPDSAVIQFYDNAFAPDDVSRPYHARFAAAVRAALLESERPERRAAYLLAHHPDPRALPALRKMHAEIRVQEHADQVALTLRDSRDPADQALFGLACQRNPKDAACSRTHGSEFPDFAGDPVPDEAPPDAAAIRAAIDQLAAAGFSKVSTVDPAQAQTDSADVLLVMAGHGYWFDVETGFFPNQHDSLMRQLALLAAPALDDAIFEETPPSMDAVDTDPYVLTVYSGGKRLRADARNFGDWYDTEAVIQLMNRVTQERGIPVRYLALTSSDQTMTIVAGPPGAIARALQAGLIEVDAGHEAMNIGKDFERKIGEAFKN